MVSIIVPLYKVEAYIQVCASSLFAQTQKDQIEFIFVDDGSPDNSLELVRQTAALFPERKNQVQYLTLPSNQGNAMARNHGLALAKGSYILQVDADDRLAPNMIEKLYKQALASNADMVICNCVEEYPHKQLYSNLPPRLSAQQLIQGMPYQLVYSVLWNKLIKRSLYENHHIQCYPHTNTWVDIGVVMRMAYFAKNISVVPDVLYHYNRTNEEAISSKTSLTKVNHKIQTAQNLVQFFQQQAAFEPYKKTLYYLLYLAKDRLLYSPSVRDYPRWKSLFPETHAYIWLYPQLSLFKRVVFSLAAWGAPSIALFLLHLRQGNKQVV